MDTSQILRPHELPFAVPEFLAHDINELIAALERDDVNLDAYLDEVDGSARGVRSEQDDWLRQYYVNFGWRKLQNERAD